MPDQITEKTALNKPKRPGPLILGIDPGTRCAGFAFIQSKKLNPLTAKDFTIVDAGVIKFNAKLPVNTRLGMLHNAIHQLCIQHAPDHCVLEQAFFGVNMQSTLRLGEARGACMSALFRLNTALSEMSPNQMKKAITGRGHASKEEVAFAVKHLLAFDQKDLPFDVTDAMALALSFGLGLATMAHLAPPALPTCAAPL